MGLPAEASAQAGLWLQLFEILLVMLAQLNVFDGLIQLGLIPSENSPIGHLVPCSLFLIRAFRRTLAS